MSTGQLMMLRRIGNIRPDIESAVRTSGGTLRFIERYSRRKMDWFIARMPERRSDLISMFKLKELTRWLEGPLPDAIAGARDFVNAVE